MTTEDTYLGPGQKLLDAGEERELVRLALNDAWGFEYHAPRERDWWGVFWDSMERHQHERRVTGQTGLDGWSE